jgi:tetratricopeptide (TPR) repeat protein
MVDGNNADTANSANENVITKKKSPLPIIIVAIVVALAVIAGVVIFVVAFALGADKREIKKQLKLGDKYLSSMDYENAILAYDKVLAIDPNNVDAYIGDAKAYKGLIASTIANGEIDQADIYLSAVIVILEDGLARTNNQEIAQYLEEFKEQKDQLSASPAEDEPVEPGEEAGEGELTAEELFALLPKDFVCTPGEDWGSWIELNDDGTFKGEYQYYDFSGVRAYEVHQVSNYTGRFTNVKKVDEFTYSVEVADLSYEREVGTSESETDAYGLRITEYVEARGLANAGTIYIYLKGADLSSLSPDFLKYIEYDPAAGVLPCYGIYNPNDEGYGFEGK